MALDYKKNEFQKVVNDQLECEKENLALLSSNIWNKPELKFEENFAHDLLTEFLESRGFTVKRNYILPTAFRAEYERRNGGCGKVISAAILCEYDALPQIGHACGHNLIAEVGVACSLAVKHAMEIYNIFGKIVVFGTPAEEGGGGKVHLIDGGAFENIDFAVMAHPSPLNTSGPELSSALEMFADFEGKEAHAGLAPWDGLNALDAAVACYSNISLLRQQIRTDARINIAIRDGGHAVNVIPNKSKVELLLRTSITSDMQKLKTRVVNCIESAAKATGCQVKIKQEIYQFYKHIIQNEVIESIYVFHGKNNGILFSPNEKRGPSTDCGNVSHILPTLHPVFNIGVDSKPHTVEFAAAAISPVAQPYALRTAKVLALTVLDLLSDPKLVDLALEKFNNTERQP